MSKRRISKAELDDEGPGEKLPECGLKPPGLWVVFATATGNAENLARQAVDAVAERNLSASMSCLGDYASFKALGRSRVPVVFFISTYADGEPPDMAKQFFAWLASDDRDLERLKYCVVGLGSNFYERYQRVGTLLDERLAALGATRLLPRAEVEDSTMDEDFQLWLSQLWPALDAHAAGLSEAGFGAAHTFSPIPPSPAAGQETPIPEEDFESELPRVPQWGCVLRPQPPEAEGGPSGDLSPLRSLLGLHVESSALRMLPCTVNEELFSSSERSCRLISFPLASAGLQYETGDHLAVMPRAPLELVHRICARLRIVPEARFTAEPAAVAEGVPRRSQTPASGRPTAPFLGDAWTLEQAFSSFVDIVQPPTRKLLAEFARHAKDESERTRLKGLAIGEEGGPEGYAAWVRAAERSVVEVLEAFPSVDLPLERLFAGLPRLAPRYYSIASAPAASAGAAEIVVGVVRYTTPAGRIHEGLCSSALARLVPGADQVPIFVRSSTFRLPTEATRPIIMVGPGTGLAPFRAFLQEMVVRGAGARCETHLYCGCRTRGEEIFADFFEGLRTSGLLTARRVAYSREAERVHVQNCMLDDGETLWNLLAERGAHLFVCGDAQRMAPAVHSTVVRIVELYGGLGHSAAESFVKGLVESSRYLSDVW
eukprot:tig00021433_g21273.t1